ncbi:hypothetical protein Goshw_026451 [Gossypium schwendimanii]|uniref:Uncharacterized protein n=2 Tax=Gossypium schwendimanii TaxID=34291 RepID=A0A7J9N9W1_GOSSC|nr:hypothetical protein [Gossypium schwendimanii]
MGLHPHRQASVSSSCPALEPGLQLLHILEGRFGAYNRRIQGFTSVYEDSSGQSLLKSCKCTDLFEEADEYNGDEPHFAHPDARKKVDVFDLSMYGLVVFPKAFGHVEEAVTDLFDRLDKRVTSVSIILAETFRSLNAYRRAGEGRFIGSA